MVLDYTESILELAVNLIAVSICLFQYISHKSRSLFYITAIFLLGLMSCYYWTAFLLIMGDSPNVSNLFYYSGWNAAYAIILILILHLKSPEEKRYFHPLMLLPIPLNLWQLSLYLPYGGQLNSIYQVVITTVIACFSLQSICFYIKKQKKEKSFPYFSLAMLLFVFFSYGMWTSSSISGVLESLYYPFSFFNSLNYLFIVWALIHNIYDQKRESAHRQKYQKYYTILKGVYLAVVMICSFGGMILGLWMKHVMIAAIDPSSGKSTFDIITVVLFIISVFLAAFVVTIIILVNFAQKIIENNEYREARRIAERSNTAKSEFLANMSHEIRTPINAILGMNEIILRNSLESKDSLPKEREKICDVFKDICIYSGNIESAGNNLLSIINDILDFSKIEAGKLEIINADYRFGSVLNDVSNMIVFKAQSKNLKYHVQVESNVPDHLFGDEVRIRQIITNILNNAVKYTETGSVSLNVSCDPNSTIEKGELIDLIITVRDTGIGIRPEDIDKLFKKFERMDLERNSTVEGTGLGLAITQSLLTLMNGRIKVDSIYGEGSTFTIHIPQKVVSCEPVGNFREKFEKSMKTAKARTEIFHAPDARILIVDDTGMNLTVAIGLLRHTKIQIDTALSGAESIRLAAKNSYDVILMDQRMPKMSGTEALHEIRRLEEGLNRNTPVICLTADAVSGAREIYLSEGFDDYLTKPVDGNSLEQILIRYLPSGKVHLYKETQENAEEANNDFPKTTFDILREAGLDPETGLQYCDDDRDFYKSILSEYLDNKQNNLSNLQEYYDQSDWENYSILAHSLKSTSKMIGAAEFSEYAARMEKASAAQETETVLNGHAGLIGKYISLCTVIRQALQAEK
jgi:signal transduction histidine kinase/DNA-binding NarL/FixJ family response regulator/HPt (histidine-containing phosphotransfer) domain-containing protein